MLLPFLFSVVQAKQQVLKFGVTPAYDIPFLFVDKNTGVMTGIAIDIVEHIAKGMDAKAAVINLPRGRIEPALADGTIDLICYSNPGWTKQPELYKWSDPILELSDHVIRYKKAAPIKTLDDLKGQSVGMVGTYFYEKIMPLVKNKTIERSDFFDGNGIFKRLQMGQIYYGILNSYFLQYQQVELTKYVPSYLPSPKANANQTSAEPQVFDTGVIDSHYKIYCRAHKKNKIGMDKVNKALIGFKRKTYSIKDKLEQ